MKKVNHFLTEPQIKMLKTESRCTKLPVAEIIRRAIDEYFKGSNKQHTKLYNRMRD